MKNKMQKNRSFEKGFTLVEMAIAMLIISLLIGFATVAFSGMLKRNYEQKTFANMEVIADAIAVYAQKHMRVPCPADPLLVTGAVAGREPFGAERGSAPVGTIFGTCNTVADAEGIIPFATLGLPRRMAQDRFGNFITYRVSVTSALQPEVASEQRINNWCMTEPYWYADTDNTGGPDPYVSAAKAAFCCGTWVGVPGAMPDITGDVQIQGSFLNDPAVAGGSRSLPNLTRSENITINGVLTGVGANVAEYRFVASGTPTPEADLSNGIVGLGATLPPSFPAYVLISHGQNRLGAYSPTTGTRSLAGLNAVERENADNDVNFFASDRTAPRLPTGAGNQRLDNQTIDDLVFWETPSQILGRIGGISCSSP